MFSFESTDVQGLFVNRPSIRLEYLAIFDAIQVGTTKPGFTGQNVDAVATELRLLAAFYLSIDRVRKMARQTVILRFSV